MEEKANKIIEQVYLKDYTDYVQVDDKYYGGDQDWLYQNNQISEFWADRSCGVIAVANILYHTSQAGQVSITKEDYIATALTVYQSIRPSLYGIPTVNMMKKRLQKLAKDQNKRLTYYPLVNPSNIIETVTYIKEALTKNYPIMLLTWKTRIQDLVYHWVNITGYYKMQDNKHYAVISNYGIKEIISIDQWVGEWSIYKALLYFTLED